MLSIPINASARFNISAIQCKKHAIIKGVDCLVGTQVESTDLRAGAALIIAGLAASGITEIEDIFHIERGYDSMDVKLRAIGADIQKVSEPDEISETDVQPPLNRNESAEKAEAV